MRLNAAYVQGVGPGYKPTAGSGLTLNLASGTSFCSGAVRNYTGGTLTLTASVSNYVYLDPAASCAPAVNTTGFTAGVIPIATVTTGSTGISAISDVRTAFTPAGAGGTTTPSEPVNNQTSSGYTIASGDQGKLITLSNASDQTVTLPSTAPATGWFVDIENRGAGTWTLSPNGLQLDGAASGIAITTGEGLRVASDGANYFALRGNVNGGVVTPAKINGKYQIDGTTYPNLGAVTVAVGAGAVVEDCTPEVFSSNPIPPNSGVNGPFFQISLCKGVWSTQMPIILDSSDAFTGSGKANKFSSTSGTMLRADPNNFPSGLATPPQPALQDSGTVSGNLAGGNYLGQVSYLANLQSNSTVTFPIASISRGGSNIVTVTLSSPAPSAFTNGQPVWVYGVPYAGNTPLIGQFTVCTGTGCVAPTTTTFSYQQVLTGTAEAAGPITVGFVSTNVTLQETLPSVESTTASLTANHQLNVLSPPAAGGSCVTGCSFSISSASRSGSTVTITTSANHNFQTGELISVSGITAGSASFASGTYQVTVTGANTLTYTQGTGNGTSTANTGTASATYNALGISAIGYFVYTTTAGGSSGTEVRRTPSTCLNPTTGATAALISLGSPAKAFGCPIGYTATFAPASAFTGQGTNPTLVNESNPLVVMGSQSVGDNTARFYTRIERVSLDCSGIAGIGTYYNGAQEQSGLFNVDVIVNPNYGTSVNGGGCLQADVYARGPNAQNSSLVGFTTSGGYSAGAAAPNYSSYVPILLDARAGGTLRQIRDLTITPYNSPVNTVPYGIYLAGAYAVLDISVIHCEAMLECMRADNNARPVIHSVTGNSSITNVIHLTPSSGPTEVHDIRAGGATNSILDESFAGSCTNTGASGGSLFCSTQDVSFYSISATDSGGNRSRLTTINNAVSSLPSVMAPLWNYSADTGTGGTNNYVINPAITSLQAGQTYVFEAVNANTGASTLNVNGLGPKTIKKNGGTGVSVGSDLAANDIKAGQIVEVTYDGTNFQIQSVPGNAPGGGGGSPGGSNTQIQYNSSGAFAGASNVMYSSTTGQVTANQLTNGNETIYGKRTTDSSPAGSFLHFQNNAGTSDLFKVDVSGNATLASGLALGVPLTVSNGGTGVATLTAHGILVGEAGGNITATAAGAVDNLLQGQGASADPAYVAVNNCSTSSSALTYNTSTHAFGCNTISGSGTVNAASQYAIGYYPNSGSNAVIAGSSLLTTNANNQLNLAQGTITSSAPALNVTSTWNNSGTTFTGLLENVTNAASATGSRLLDLQVGGTSEFSVTSTGNGVFAGTLTSGTSTAAGTLTLGAASATGASSDVIHGGSTASNGNPGFLELTQSPADAKLSFLYPCNTAGKFCQSATTPAADSANVLQAAADIQGNVASFWSDTGAANAYVITPSPVIAAYAAGQEFKFQATNANTGASTLNVNSQGTKTIKKNGGTGGSVGSDLAANDIKTGQIVDVVYDGTNFQMESALGNAASGGGSSAFGSITSGTNTSATMTLGSGSTLNTAVSGTEIVDFSNVAPGSFKIPIAASATTSANGTIAYDSTNNMPHIAVNSADAKIGTFTGSPVNGDCVKWSVSGNVIQLADQGSTCGGGGGAPAGSNTQVQFNNSGAFGASANLTWVSPTLTIGVGGTTTGQLALAGATSGTTTLTPNATASGTLTVPAATDTLVARNTTDTLKNKTLTSASSGNSVQLLKYIPQQTSVTLASSTNTYSVVSFSIPGNTIPANACAEATVGFRHTGTNSINYNWNVGGSIASSVVTGGTNGVAFTHSGTAEGWSLVYFCNGAATNANQINQPPSDVGAGNWLLGGMTTAAIDTTAAQNLIFTANPAAGTTDTVQADWFIVKLIE